MVWSDSNTIVDFLNTLTQKKPGMMPSTIKVSRQTLEPPSPEQRLASRQAAAATNQGALEAMFGGYSTDPSSYLAKAEQLNFQANQIQNRAAQTRLQRSIPRTVLSTQINESGQASASGAKGKFGAFLRAIAGKESGGNYGAVNHSSGALGKYQIMPGNIPSWSKQALGHSVSAQQFLHSPQLQEQIAQYQLRNYFNKYGAAGAASAWYSGNPNAWKNSYAKQGAYPSIHAYVMSILNAMR